MKLDVNFSALWAAVRAMGPQVALDDFTLTIRESPVLQLDTDLSAVQGIEIVLDDIDADSGVLSYQGRQILLFIPDQGMNIDEALEDPLKGRRYHVAECKTLADMRSKNRFGRYRATNNLQGKFHIFGVSKMSGANREGEAGLKVCMNCLEYLNYQGYKTDRARKKQIHSGFDIAQFLSHYSTLFKSMPPASHFEEKGGYADDWADISARYRQSKNYTCECCSVNLSQHKQLLHTHHINGNKRQNDTHNLMALCIDCHRKQPQHEYMRVNHADMLEINRLRREQGLFRLGDWDDAINMADTSIRGVLLAYRSQGSSAPVIGYEITDINGAVIAQIEAAWPEQRFGLVIAREDYDVLVSIGWNVHTIGEALKSIN